MKSRMAINLPTLVLNKGWMPISIMPVKKAIPKVLSDLAKILDPSTSSLLTFEEWMTLEVDEDQPYIQTPHSKIRVPEIIVLSEYDKVPQREVKLTRRNLLIRDNFTCQYTGIPITMDSATIDHVIPRSKGGKSTWDNLVMCCLEVNAKKADRTLAESGLKLLKKPVKPKWNPVYARFAKLTSSSSPESWKLYLKDFDKFSLSGKVVSGK